MVDQVIDTWNTHNRIILYLLETIEPKALNRLLSGARSHTVARMFVHLHNIRVRWIETMLPELLKGIKTIEQSEKIDKRLLHKSIEQSGQAIEALLKKGPGDDKLRSFNLHPAAFLGYLISHEAHHRGEICVALTQSGPKFGDGALNSQQIWNLR